MARVHLPFLSLDGTSGRRLQLGCTGWPETDDHVLVAERTLGDGTASVVMIGSKK